MIQTQTQIQVTPPFSPTPKCDCRRKTVQEMNKQILLCRPSVSVPAGRKGEKGQTLEQVEEMEGGTIKESKIGMAAAKRVDRRKQKASRDGKKKMNKIDQRLDAAAI